MKRVDACTVCGSLERSRLPDPHSGQSMLSDGRIWKGPLDKAICRDCQTVSHATTLSSSQVKKFYDKEYNLGVDVGAADLTRNIGYAQFVSETIERREDLRVLEIGCGSGQVLRYLAGNIPDAYFVGIEAAEQLATNGFPQLEIRKAFLEDLEAPEQGYDFAYAINVIEHASDPARFLSALGAQIRMTGKALMICPAPSPPNLELLFRDHVTSFSHTGFETIANAAGLLIVSASAAPPQFPGFQAFVLAFADVGRVPPAASGDRLCGDRATEVTAYLSKWASLDQVLCDRVGKSTSIDIFGAGEIAALLRCYTPRLWHRAERLVVDSLPGARNLGKPLVTLDVMRPQERPIVVATHPRAQVAVAERLIALGRKPILFNDIIKA